MTNEPDPYRVLGLPRSATTDEIRRAYRHLVKEYHPDSAGPAALPRFLAIQAAYELLAGGAAARRIAGRPAGRPAARDATRRPSDPSAAPPGGPAAAGGASGSTASTGGGKRRAGARPAAAGQTTSNGSRGTRGGAGATGPTRKGRRRSPNKATLGSTSYDSVDDEPFDPEWSGGTWYGASSGTYWTINPKEYADPRKHGPEYQARARRRVRDSMLGAAGQSEGPAAGTRPGEQGANDERGDPAASTFRDSTGDEEADGWSAAAPAEPQRAAGTAMAASSGSTDGMDPFAAAAQIAMTLAFTPRGFMARVGLALIGWPAIGLALTTAAGEITGCSRFAATCVDLFGVGTWLGQLIIIGILLVLPSLAALSAVGSLVALAASVPTAVFLSATGGSHEPATSATILGVVLAIAYLAGVVFAAVRRRRRPGLP
jgi:hypothetical protein